MHWLHEHDYAVIDLNEALRRLGSETSESVRYVVLTFDDGFHDFLIRAWPVLKEFGHKATVFLPTDFIGNSRKSFKGRECLTWSEVRELHSYGVSFGSHTVSHSLLYNLPWDEVQRELLDSKLRLEDELRTSVQCFSYPHAFPQEDKGFVRRLKKELINQGYDIAVTTMIGRPRNGSDPRCLKRLPINEDDDVQLFQAKLAGAYDWLAGAQSFVRRMKLYLGSSRQKVA